MVEIRVFLLHQYVFAILFCFILSKSIPNILLQMLIGTKPITYISSKNIGLVNLPIITPKRNQALVGYFKSFGKKNVKNSIMLVRIIK